MSTICHLTKRKLQAEVIGPIYAEMVAELGEEKASEILDRAIRKAAINEGRAFAARAPAASRPWPISSSSSNCGRRAASRDRCAAGHRQGLRLQRHTLPLCRDLSRMGLGKIGHLLSCNRDGSFCEGYDPRLKLERKTDHHGRARVLHLPLFPAE